MFLVFVPRNTNTHTETQFTQHEASLDIERVLSQLIGCTLRLDTPNYILFIKFSSKRFLLISVHQNHLYSCLWDNVCNYIWSQIISIVNYKLQIKCHIISFFDIPYNIGIGNMFYIVLKVYFYALFFYLSFK